MFWKSSSLEIETLQRYFFVHPPRQGQPGNDPLIHGKLTLTLKKPSRVDSLTVTLLGLFDLYYSDIRLESTSQRSGKTLERTVSLAPGDDELPAGQSVFGFTIAIPSSTATNQRCPYGRIRHKLVAKAVLGRTTLVQEEMLQLVASPTPDCGPPMPLALVVQDFVPELGAVQVNIESSYFTVGGPVLVDIYLPEVPAQVDIMNVELCVLQTFELHMLEKVISPPTLPRRVFLVDRNHPASTDPSSVQTKAVAALPTFHALSESPLATIKEGTSWTMKHLARIPNDDCVRPTTHAQADAPIKISHKLELNIAFQRSGEGAKSMVVKRPVELASCCCLLSSVRLPQYSAEPRVCSKPLFRCICGATVKDLIDEDGLPHHNSVENPNSTEPALGHWKLAPDYSVSVH